MTYNTVDPVPEDEMDDPVEPVDNSEMWRRKYLHHHTICATLRLIWRRATDPESRLLCRQAMAYAKRMHKRLEYYHDKYEPERKTYFDGAPSGRSRPREQA